MIRSIPIRGCAVVPVKPNLDGRGCLFELFRESWANAFHVLQWNACVSKSGVLRGVHVHVEYDEYYTLPSGRVLFGLHDIRRSSPTFGASTQFEWKADDRIAVVIPRGVAHMAYVIDDSVLVFGMNGYWSVEHQDLGCRWDDPALGFKLPTRNPVCSERDASAGSLDAMMVVYENALEKSHVHGALKGLGG